MTPEYDEIDLYGKKNLHLFLKSKNVDKYTVYTIHRSYGSYGLWHSMKCWLVYEANLYFMAYDNPPHITV